MEYVTEISGSHGGEYKDETFWNTAPCDLVETSVYLNEITRHYIPKGCHRRGMYKILLFQ
jgi:hypothetical protein